MLELQQQDIPKLKSERTVSNNTGQDDGSNNGNSYDLVFPALPDSKTLGPKNVGINGQCPSSNAPSKGWSKPRPTLSTVNQVFTISVQDRKSDNSEKFGEGESKRICSQITRETGAEIEISTSKNMNLTFLVRGKVADVVEAKRRIIASFQTQATSAVPVPKEHHCQVMGKQGTRRKEIEQRTGARIQMPSIQDTSDIINVTGTRDAVEKAVQEIRMISDELSKKAFERIEIPKVFHPFITGGHNEKLNSLMKETGVKIHVPPPSVNRDEITIAGDKEGVQLAIDSIKQIYTKMEKESATVFVEIPKQKHKYLMAQKGNGIQDILAETYVSVEMPQQDSDKETVTLRGLYKDLGTGLTKLYEKANSMAAETIECPGWMHRFLIGKNGSNLRELIEDNEKVHVEFSDDNKIIVEGPTDMIPKVIDSLKKAIECYVSTELVVDPKFFKHIIGKNGTNINRVKNDTGVIINISESENNSNIIRIEGRKDGVEAAKSELEEMIYKLENEVEKEISIDQRHHRAIIGVKGEKVRELQEAFNVQITFPSSVEARSNLVKIRGLNDDVNKAFKSLAKLAKELDEANYVLEIPVFKQFHKLVVGKGGANIKKIREETDTRIDLPREGEDSDTIKVMGNKEKVLIACDMIKKIQNEMGDIVTKEIVLGNIKVRNVMVNLGNKFIQSIKEDCGGNVTLKLPAVKGDNTIVIKGPEDDVDSAISQIQTMVDEVYSSVLDIKVKPEFHKYLIGKKRANVKRIRDLTNTRIIFPLETDSTNENITIVGRKENVDKAKAEFEVMITDISNVIEERIEINEKYHKSFVAKRGEFLHRLEDECGGVKISFPKPGAGDKVVLKGSKANVALAKQKLLDHAKILENTIQVEINVDPKFHRHFVSRRGEIINRIIDDCNGVSITFPKLLSNDSIVIIKGDKTNAEEAKRKIEEIVKDLENIVEIVMDVPPKHHRYFVARRAEVINQISAEYNGVTITFPQMNSNSSEVLIKGHKDFVEKVKNKINNIVVDLEQRITIDVIIPQRMHRVLMRNRDLLEGLRRDLDVWIKFPERPSEDQYNNRELEDINGGEEPDENRTPSVNDIVTIFGKPEYCESAKQILIDNVPKTIDLNVPSEYHRSLIGTKGATIRKLSEDYNVQIKVPNQEYSADIIKITGVQKDIDEVVAAIKEEMRLYDADKEDRQLRSYEIQMNIEPEFHPMIIGKKGETVRNLRNKYSVQVNLPRRGEGNNEDIVTVVGYQENAEKARDEIQEMVDKLKNVYKEEIFIDNRIHSRLIGFRGRNISQIMDKYHVDIRFSKSDSSNPDLVVVYAREDATQDDVLDCMDYLDMIQQDYMTDLLENEARANLNPKPDSKSVPNGNHNSQGSAGFVMGNGAPWEKAHPDTNSTRDFPSFAGIATSANSSASSDKTNLPNWGSGRR
ncbi:K Homology domain,K Homology domain, type 1 [Cinara cedri]|uniref:K Homology domain,K Homology domain, type 1 n=1 Tax=Cinara cedri TaxID=506608 RepID=A0A5E4NDT9_9HEMI|nr:K Homology domain,K Homology domain, type 1 [Cinara cedri]